VGVLLQAAGWHFLVLRRERASRIAALPPQGTGLPRTFHPDPIAEWVEGQRVLIVFAVVAALGAYASTRLMSFDRASGALALMAAGAAAAAAYARWRHVRVLTVRVERHDICLARGRGERLQWESIPRSDIEACSERHPLLGSRWLELKFKDRWRKLKIKESSIVDYWGLHRLLKPQ